MHPAPPRPHVYLPHHLQDTIMWDMTTHRLLTTAHTSTMQAPCVSCLGQVMHLQPAVWLRYPWPAAALVQTQLQLQVLWQVAAQARVPRLGARVQACTLIMGWVHDPSMLLP